MIWTYTEQLDKAFITRSEDVDAVAKRIINNRARYEAVAKDIGCPWYFIGALHYRESNLSFTDNLCNGEPLDRKTRLVPKGRGPYDTWEESAIDALELKDLQNKKSWTWEDICYETERYNGFGYKNKGLISPYLWSGSNIYTKGKYISDGKFSANTVDKQLGAITLMRRIVELTTKSRDIVNASGKLSFIQKIKNAIVATVTAIMSADWFGLLGQAKQFATDHAGILLIGGAATAWVVFKLIQSYSVSEYKQGNYTPDQWEKF